MPKLPKLPRAEKRYGNGFWGIRYRGKLYRRKIRRRIIKGRIVWFAWIKGKLLRVQK